jgi:hypothetical protein
MAVVPRRLNLALGVCRDGLARHRPPSPLSARRKNQGQVKIARATHYATQERVVTLIAHACAAYDEIQALDIYLRKQPVLAGTGNLGVRLRLNGVEIAALRKMDS